MLVIVLKVQAKEGLPIGLAISVRYHLDAARRVHIHNTQPTAVDSEVVRPVIASTFRGIAPNYTVREVFVTKREEICQHAGTPRQRRAKSRSRTPKELPHAVARVTRCVRHAKGDPQLEETARPSRQHSWGKSVMSRQANDEPSFRNLAFQPLSMAHETSV
jgi:hypothetical protein